jgi:hypothetical protein
VDEAQEKDWFFDKWGWYNTIDELFAKGDITKFQSIYKMNVFDFLNHLAFLNDKQSKTKKQWR